MAVPRAGRCALAIVLLLLSTGCVTRRMMIKSDPPGARAYVGDVEIGTTPVSHDFTYYGTRKIRLVKDGYETLIVNQPFPAPWYQIPPIDFVTENLVPGEIRDERLVTYQMRPLQLQSREQLLQKGEALRRASLGLPQAGNVIPAGATNIPPSNGIPGQRGPEVLPTPPGYILPNTNGGATLPPSADTPQWVYPSQTRAGPLPGVIAPTQPVAPVVPGTIAPLQ